jgi:hypothetical protein
MGTPVEPIEYRDDCLICPILFPPGKTPKTIHIVFHGIEKCPGTTREPPNDKVFHLGPDPVDNCSWYNPSHPDISIVFTFHYGFTLVTGCFRDTSDSFFNSLEVTPSCVTDGIVNAQDCVSWHYFGGTARVFWEPDSIPFIIASDYGFSNNPDVLFDRLTCGIDHQIIKLARRCDKTNCLFYIDNEEF